MKKRYLTWLIPGLVLAWSHFLAAQTDTDAAPLPFDVTFTIEKGKLPTDDDDADSSTPTPKKSHEFMDYDRTRTSTAHFNNSTSSDIKGISVKLYVIGQWVNPFEGTPRPNESTMELVNGSGQKFTTNTAPKVVGILKKDAINIPASQSLDLGIGSIPFHVHQYDRGITQEYHGDDYLGYVVKFYQDGKLIGTQYSQQNSAQYIEACDLADKMGVRRAVWN